MYKTYKSLNKITFPLYRIPSLQYQVCDGLVYHNQKGLLDDLNVQGQTLGIRRLKSPHKKQMKKLRLAIFNIPQLLKKSAKQRIVIDSSGSIFQYRKTRQAQLISYKVKNIHVQKSLIQYQGVDTLVPFKQLPMGQPLLWSRVICIDKIPWALYSFTTSRVKDSRIRI